MNKPTGVEIFWIVLVVLYFLMGMGFGTKIQENRAEKIKSINEIHCQKETKFIEGVKDICPTLMILSDPNCN